MSLIRKTRTRLENILAWVFALTILGLIILGVFYVMEAS